jgi:ABC-type glycerol-3-phosphate transport system substrate-binding protein
MYVNEEVLQQANVRSIPRTWTEFAEAIQQVSRGDVRGWANYPSASTINAWAYSRGGTMLTTDNKQVRYLEAPYLDSFQLTEDAFKRNQAYNPPRTPGSDADFVANKFAFIQQSSTSRPFLMRVMKDNGREKLPWRIASLPQKDVAKPATVQYGANIAVFRTTPEKQVASWLFVKFFTERDQSVEWSITSSYMPVRRSASESARLKAHWDQNDPQGRQAFELSRTASPEPNIRGVQETRPIIQKALQDVMEGKASSRAALEEAARAANVALQQMA